MKRKRKKDLETPHFGDHNQVINNPKLFDTFVYSNATRQDFPFELFESFKKAKRIDGKRVSLEEELSLVKGKPFFVYISKYPVFSAPYLLQWRRPFKKTFPEASSIMLGVQEFNPYFFISYVLRKSVMKRLEKEEIEEFVMVYDNTSNTLSKLLFDSLNLKNRFGAYFFLVDSKGRIRLRGSGNATEKDLELLKQTFLEISIQDEK